MNMFMIALPAILIGIAELAVVVYCIRTLFLLRKSQQEYMQKIDTLMELLNKHED